MADNVAITAGAGTTVATDEVAGVHYQKVKLALGAADTANLLAVGAGAVDTGTPRVTHASDDPVTTAVQIMDDWDESDRAKVNPIVGQAGIDGGAGAATSKTVRVTIDTGQVAGPAVSASATFTPAAASHAAGDCNGAAQEFALSAPSAGRIMITSATLEIDGGTAEATAWRLHLFNVTPPSAVADDSPHTLPSGDRSAYLGYVDLGTAADAGDTQWIETHGINKQIKLAGTSVFGYLTNLTTLTPANVAHIVTLHAVPL
jgi:hypothetical protein